MDRVFSALSDPTRRSILERLSTGSLTVTELANPYSCSLPAISKHLRVLESAGLLVRTTEGRLRHCRLVPEAMEEASQWMARYGKFWNERLDALGKFLGESEEENT